MKGLLPVYYKRMFASPIMDFKQLCNNGMRIEDAMDNGQLDKREGRISIAPKKIFRSSSKTPNIQVKKWKKWWNNFFFNLKSTWAEIEPLSWDLRLVHSKIWVFELLSAIRVIEPWSDQAKPRFASSSQNLSLCVDIRAIEPRYEPNWA